MGEEIKDFIDKASKLKVEDGYSTTYQTCIELSIKIKELEAKIEELELRIKKLEEIK